jgi:predicted acetyltransferase
MPESRTGRRPEAWAWEGWLTLAGPDRLPLTVADAARPERSQVWLFATEERARTAALVAGSRAAVTVRRSAGAVAGEYHAWLRHTGASLHLETPCGRVIWGPEGAESAADGLVSIDDAWDAAFDDIQRRGFGDNPREGDGGDDGAPVHRSGWLRDGLLAAGLEAKPFTSVWGDAVLPIELLGGVVTPLEARRQGAARALVRGALAAMRDRGTPLSAVTSPFSYPFYGRLGYAAVYERLTLTGRPDVFLRLPAVPGRLRHYPVDREGRALPFELALLYELGLGRRFQGWARRTAAQWHGHLRGRLTDAYVWDGPGGPSGYMILQSRPGRVAVHELVALDDNALLGMARMLGSLDSQTDSLVWDALPDTPLRRWVPEPDLLREERTPQGMFRLVNVPTALAARPVPRDVRGSLHLAVSDPLCDWNSGVWRLTFQGGRAEAVRAEGAEAASHCSIQALSLIYAGSHTPAEAVRFADAQLAPADADLLAAAYPARPPLLLEWF